MLTNAKIENLKQIEDLKDGNCIIVTSDNMKYKGTYSSKHKVVFFAIPAGKKILGYIQE